MDSNCRGVSFYAMSPLVSGLIKQCLGRVHWFKADREASGHEVGSPSINGGDGTMIGSSNSDTHRELVFRQGTLNCRQNCVGESTQLQQSSPSLKRKRATHSTAITWKQENTTDFNSGGIWFGTRGSEVQILSPRPIPNGFIFCVPILRKKREGWGSQSSSRLDE